MATAEQYPSRVVVGVVPCQTVYELQADQLVLRFRSKTSERQIVALLKRLGATPVELPGGRGRPTSLSREMRWVRLHRAPESLPGFAREVLATHARIEAALPVYYAAGEGPASAAAPLPGSLLLRFRGDKKDEGLKGLAKEPDLVYDAAFSALLEPFVRFRVRAPGAEAEGPEAERRRPRTRRKRGGGRAEAPPPAPGEPSAAFGLAGRVAKLPIVEVVELDWMKLDALEATIPNDTFWANQWDMVRIHMPDAWDEQTGGPTVVIGVIDSGCDLTHPDLAFTPVATHFNAQQAADGDPTPYDANPDLAYINGAHGSLVAGLAAATFNNSQGIAGVAGGCLIMPLRIFPNAATAWLAAAINWARTNGADVVNMSLSWTTTAAVTTALNNAWTAGMVLCAASGNYYSAVEPASAPVKYPARHARVLAVGASDQADERKRPASVDGEEWGSHYGTDLDVMAPGQGLWSTDIQGANGWNSNNGGAMTWQGVAYTSCGDASGDYFALMGGTSGASPHAAGLAALLMLRYPTLSNQQIRDIIERTCEKVNAGMYPYAHDPSRPNGTWHEQMGYGRINADAALRCADVMVADHDLDDGSVPSCELVGGVWTPRRFWRYQPYVTTTSQPSAMPSAHEPAQAGQNNYVHALVTNLGPAVAQSIQLTWHVMDYPGTELIWPADWNPGNQIASATIGPLNPGVSEPVEALWPQALVNIAAAYAHPCMVVQAICDQDSGGDLGDHVREYNNIAQHNISFASTEIVPGAGTEMRAATLPFAVGHPLSRSRLATLIFDLRRAAAAGVFLDLDPPDDLPYVDRIRDVARKHPPRGIAARACGARAVADTRLELACCGCRAEVLLKAGSTLRLLCDGLHRAPDLDALRLDNATPVSRQGRLQLLLRPPLASVGLPLLIGQVVPLALTVATPPAAGRGYCVDVTQVSEGVPTGGLSFEVES